jgi:hypothetical protein
MAAALAQSHGVFKVEVGWADVFYQMMQRYILKFRQRGPLDYFFSKLAPALYQVMLSI